MFNILDAANRAREKSNKAIAAFSSSRFERDHQH
jgi:hypothetical protein